MRSKQYPHMPSFLYKHFGFLGDAELRFAVWAFQTLGKFYTRTLRVTESHNVVQEGPYKKVRHPGYLGVVLVLVGAGLATVNWLAAVIVTLTTIAAYCYRITCEENTLVASFGKKYREYMKHTWKLILFVY